jgi:hypothetical protein
MESIWMALILPEPWCGTQAWTKNRAIRLTYRLASPLLKAANKPKSGKGKGNGLPPHAKGVH